MENIYVTKTYLPPIEEYQKYLRQIWGSAWLTNEGPLLKQFEANAAGYLGVDNFQYVANGTLALQLALRAFDITDSEVITTPFSYVATISAILWERCTPVFVDIDPETLCIDPSKIEAAITDRTRAIMPVHVFGNACNVEEIERIASQHNLKTIYDGAHAFGTKYHDKSLLSYGDISTCSFHATKVFHTIEGGCVITKDRVTLDKVELMKRFGHNSDDHIMLGINAKASEFHAAMGLCNLKHIDDVINQRCQASEAYDKLLGDKFWRPQKGAETSPNYGYYPIAFKTEDELLSAIKNLEAEGIFPRRYFYPSLNKLPYIEAGQDCPISEDIAKRILCLPLYDGLEQAVIEKICKTLDQ